ncbi:MAG: ComF family protein [Spirochaetia bacterium]|nr:ComF family protein [Spirochaetales bacterium]MDX9784242.1 ComF family protein [Spirochaetia bacterium]
MSLLTGLMPRYCLLCRKRLGLGTDDSIPLCDECRAGIQPLGGLRCRRCGRPLYSEEDLCFPCRERQALCEETVPLFLYKDEAASLLKAYKMTKRFSLASFFTVLLAEQIRLRWPDRQIVPVPPRAEKLRRREWDQVEAIAHSLERMGFQVSRVLWRRPSREQKSLDRKNRSLNAREAYAVKPGCEPLIAGLCLILLDDVCTTGATLEACAELLSKAGAAKVSAIVIAAD